VRGKPATKNRPETIEKTADLVTAAGGLGIAVQVDHTDEKQVAALFKRVWRERGRLDVLVNDVWGGDDLTEWGKPIWDLSMEKGFQMMQRAVNAHIITSRHGLPLMVERDAGLVVEITDGAFQGYRGTLFYDLSKITAIRLAYAMAMDLRRHRVTALALTPGFLRSETMLDRFGVTEANWRDAVRKDKHFAESETPAYVGRAVAALAADPNVHEKAGRAFSSWRLAKEYGFTDVDGRQPDWDAHIEREIAAILDRGEPADSRERFLLEVRYFQIHLDPSKAAEARRIVEVLGEEMPLMP
jgi:NAD(P)-dependent dehydrogenase (short-subunit alcohol dehydrogenase family)